MFRSLCSLQTCSCHISIDKGDLLPFGPTASKVFIRIVERWGKSSAWKMGSLASPFDQENRRAPSHHHIYILGDLSLAESLDHPLTCRVRREGSSKTYDLTEIFCSCFHYWGWQQPRSRLEMVLFQPSITLPCKDKHYRYLKCLALVVNKQYCFFLIKANPCMSWPVTDLLDNWIKKKIFPAKKTGAVHKPCHKVSKQTKNQKLAGRTLLFTLLVPGYLRKICSR